MNRGEGGREGVAAENCFKGWPGPLHGFRGELPGPIFVWGAREQKAIRRGVVSGSQAMRSVCVLSLLL